MHKNQRIIIDTRTYVVDEIFERYKRGMLIFYKKGLATKNRENKITWQVLKALARGIPFPPVYVSELQTGEMLVLDKSDRLRLLMKYLDYGYDNYEEYLKIQEMGYWSERDFLKDIFYSPIFLHVIDYINPRYMHMQVGAFVEEWSATQEQSIRNVLYRGAKLEVFEELVSRINDSPKMRLMIQYNFIYFIMVDYVMHREFDDNEYRDADRFQLLEETMYKLKYKDYGYLRELCDQFEYLYWQFNREESREWLPPRMSLEVKMKFLCFMGAWMRIGSNHNMYDIFGNRIIRNIVRDCDMGYQSINRILEDFRKGNL